MQILLQFYLHISKISSTFAAEKYLFHVSIIQSAFVVIREHFLFAAVLSTQKVADNNLHCPQQKVS